MAGITVQITGQGKCKATHLDSGSEMETSAAPQFGGQGGTFSSTDLLITAVATCVGSSLEKVLERMGIEWKDVQIHIEKKLATSPKRIESIDLTIQMPEVSEKQQKIILNTSNTCVVKKALDPSIIIRTALSFD